ncbi:MAG: carbohydrate-binding protein, partial [Actinobacteria bacterium]
FLIINNKCAGISGGKVALQTCTGGPAQQWSVNPNGTISDIQTGHKCVRASGASVVAGSCSGAASQWTFTPAGTGGNDFALSVSPGSGSVTAGASTTAKVSTSVVSGTAQSVKLSASGAPAGVTVSFNPSSVTAGGTSTMTVATAGAAAAGTATITVTGAAAAATHAAKFTLTVGGPGGPALLSQGRPATASSLESSSFPAGNAVDGNASTRWASKEGVDPQWLRVDLGAVAGISRVKLVWEAAYAKSYTIEGGRGSTRRRPGTVRPTT